MELFVDIKKKFQNFHLEASFTIRDEIIGFLGHSGSGKSMTLRCIAGLEKPDEGKIILDGHVLFDSEKKINVPSQLRKVGLVFQNYALFPHLTVEENIGYGLFNDKKSERKQKIKEQIIHMRLDGLENQYPYQLSGGQQQRVAIARALVISPEVLLLDEPFSALDNHLRIQMEKSLLEILKDYKGSTIFVSHNINESYRICNKLYIYTNGKIIVGGNKEIIFKNPKYYEVAKITGCKNIIPAKKIGENKVHLPGLNIDVNVNIKQNQGVEYLGIRAHYIKAAHSKEDTNVFLAKVVSISNTPFRKMVYLSLHPNHSEYEEHLLLWDVSIEKWEEIENGKTMKELYIQLPIDKVFTCKV